MKRSLYFTIRILILTLLLSQDLIAQNRQVTGIVSCATSREQVPEASVTVKGTTRVTLTDAKGQFTISASPSEVLVISSIGFAPQEIKIGNSMNLTVRLADQYSDLEDVVVIGMGE